MTPDIGSFKGAPSWWQVVFLDRPERHWWDAFSPPGMRHVLCYGYVQPADAWVVVDPTQHRTMSRILSSSEMDDLVGEWMAEGCAIWQVEAGWCPTGAHRVLQTCSSIVARTIGLSGSAWRPMALLKSLRAANAVHKHGPTHERQGEAA